MQDVFDARMEIEPWETNEQQARKVRLNSLYLEIAEQTQLASAAKPSIDKNSTIDNSSDTKAEQK